MKLNMTTIKSYTDIPQSKKLAEILPYESADLWYHGHYSPLESERKYDDKPCPFHSMRPNWDKPCWSLAVLMNLLPSIFTEKGKYSKTTYKIDIRKYAFTEDVDVYQIAYGSIRFDVDGHSSFKDMINTGEKENLLDAAFQMICLLKEYDKL